MPDKIRQSAGCFMFSESELRVRSPPTPRSSDISSWSTGHAERGLPIRDRVTSGGVCWIPPLAGQKRVHARLRALVSALGRNDHRGCLATNAIAWRDGGG